MQGGMKEDQPYRKSLCAAQPHAEQDNGRDIGSCKSPRKRLMDADERPPLIASKRDRFGNEGHGDTQINARATLSVSTARNRSLPSIRKQMALRYGRLDNVAERDRIIQRRRMQQAGQRHNRPDGFSRLPEPPADRMGRRDKMGTLVPLLTLTTPGEEPEGGGAPGTGATYHLHDESAWPEVPGDNDNRFLNIGKRKIVTREAYVRRGAELDVLRACSQGDLAKALNGSSASQYPFGGAYMPPNECERGDTVLAASSSIRRGGLSQPKQVKLPPRLHYAIPYEQEDSHDI